MLINGFAVISENKGIVILLKLLLHDKIFGPKF